MKATMALALIAALSVLAGCGSADSSADSVVRPSTAILVSDGIEVTGDTATYTYGDGGAKTQIRFPIAANRADPVLYRDVQRVGESAHVVAVLDIAELERKRQALVKRGQNTAFQFAENVIDLIQDAAIAEGKRQIRDMFWKLLLRYPTLR